VTAIRIYGRTTNPDGSRNWVTVQTDPVTGDDSWVHVTHLCQVLLLVLGESPFYAQYGIPAPQSVIQNIAPDVYVARVAQQFSQYFASLIISRDTLAQVPTYNVSVTLFSGASASVTVSVPQ
jgi:hypothetical protein